MADYNASTLVYLASTALTYPQRKPVTDAADRWLDGLTVTADTGTDAIRVAAEHLRDEGRDPDAAEALLNVLRDGLYVGIWTNDALENNG